MYIRTDPKTAETAFKLENEILEERTNGIGQIDRKYCCLLYTSGIEVADRYDGAMPDANYDDSALHLVRDNSKCILCRRCVAACADQHVAVIGPNSRGFDTHIACSFEKPLSDVPCVSCGQCIVAVSYTHLDHRCELGIQRR